MAKRIAPQEPPKPALSIDQGISRLERRIKELEEFDVSSVQTRLSPEMKALEAAIEGTLSVVFGNGTPAYNRYKSACRLDDGPVIIRGSFMTVDRSAAADQREAQLYAREGIEKSIQLLKQAVRELSEEREELNQTLFTKTTTTTEVVSSRKVFVVHGHDTGVREAVARFLEKTGFEPIILHEQANKGRTIIEKVEAHGDVGFVVVLLTPDDEGCKSGEPPRPRPRQNVLLELGYFVGRLGRNKVCAFVTVVNMDLPSDFAGVVWEHFDPLGGWKQILARELQEVGFEIDWNKVMS